MAYYSIDSARNRIDIKFARKPRSEIRDFMKQRGWRWNPYEQIWFHYDSKETREWAEIICSMDASSESITPPVKKTQGFKQGDLVTFVLEDKRYVGEVCRYSSSVDQYIIDYISEYEAGIFSVERTTTLSRENLKLYHKDRNLNVETGQIVEYMSDHCGLQTAIVDSCFNASIFLCRYVIDDSGTISKEICDIVNQDRIFQEKTYAPR